MLEENSRGKEKFIPQWNEFEMCEIKLEFSFIYIGDALKKNILALTTSLLSQ